MTHLNNSNEPNVEQFLRKSMGLWILKLSNKRNTSKLKDCIEIDQQCLNNAYACIGDDVFMYGSGMSIYSPEFFNQSIDKGSICQIIGKDEGYFWNMTGLPWTQALPVWSNQSKQLIGLKLPVFIDPKNFYQYSFIISLKYVIKALKVSIEPQIDIPKDVKHEELSKSIVLIRSGNSFGTGVIIHPKGYILTNKHVIDDSDTWTINDSYSAQVVWKSKGSYDIAVLLIKEDNSSKLWSKYDSEFNISSDPEEDVKINDFPYLKLYPDSIKLEPNDEYYSTGYGTWVITKGSTFWKGYLRKLIHHIDENGMKRCQYLSHSCDTYDGNSGGPIINQQGEIVGLNFQNILIKYQSNSWK